MHLPSTANGLDVLLHEALGLAELISLLVQYLGGGAFKVALVDGGPFLANGIHSRFGGQRLEVRAAIADDERADQADCVADRLADWLLGRLTGGVCGWLTG